MKEARKYSKNQGDRRTEVTYLWFTVHGSWLTFQDEFGGIICIFILKG